MNLALNKPTFASSVTAPFGPHNAVDGGHDTHMSNGSCFHSYSVPSWWSVDLQSAYHITQVVIVNREHDNCACRK